MSKPSETRGAARIAVRRRRKKQFIANARERREEGGPVSNKWRMEFLKLLAETSNVTLSAQQAKVSLSRVYRVRRGDPEFQAQWRKALFEGYEHLELELLSYLRGTETARKIEVGGALKLLGLHAQTIARERSLADNRDEQEVFDSIDAMIDDMRARTEANEQEIARSAGERDEEA